MLFIFEFLKNIKISFASFVVKIKNEIGDLVSVIDDDLKGKILLSKEIW